LDPDDIDRSSFIIYTSGTTGRAKGVLLSIPRNLWITAACWAPICGLNDEDVVLSPLRCSIHTGSNLSVLSVLAVGASEHILERFSPDKVLELLQSGKYSVFPGVPTMFHYLAALAGGRRQSARRHATMHFCWRDHAGCIEQNLRGALRTTLLDATASRNVDDGHHELDERGSPMGSCGLPVPGLATRIVNPTTLEDVRSFRGELIVRGPNLMHGYHNKPVETAAALRKGWYHTAISRNPIRPATSRSRDASRN